MWNLVQVFVDIESEIAKRVSDYITQENKEIWLRRLAEEPPCSYTPFGENGPSVSMESSIYLINRLVLLIDDWLLIDELLNHWEHTKRL